MTEDELRIVEQHAKKMFVLMQRECQEGFVATWRVSSLASRDIPRLVAQIRIERARAEKLLRELNQEREVHDSTCAWRDQHEEAINRIGEEVGLHECDAEWSNANSPPDRIQEYIFADKKRIAELEAEVLQLRSEAEKR